MSRQWYAAKYGMGILCLMGLLAGCSSSSAPGTNSAPGNIVVLNLDRKPVDPNSYTLTLYALDPTTLLRKNTATSEQLGSGPIEALAKNSNGNLIASGMIISDNGTSGGIVSLCDATNDGIAQLSAYSTECLARARQNRLALNTVLGTQFITDVLKIPADAPITMAYEVDPTFPPSVGSMPTGEGTPTSAWTQIDPNNKSVSVFTLAIQSDTRSTTPVSNPRDSNTFFQNFSAFDCKNNQCPTLVTLLDTNNKAYPLTTPTAAYIQPNRGVAGSLEYPYFARNYTVSVNGVDVLATEFFIDVGNGIMQLQVMLQPASTLNLSVQLALPTLATRSFEWRTATSYNVFNLTAFDGVAWSAGSTISPNSIQPPTTATMPAIPFTGGIWAYAGGIGVLHQQTTQIQTVVQEQSALYGNMKAAGIAPELVAPVLLMANNLTAWQAQLANPVNQELQALYNMYTMDQFNRGLVDGYPRGVTSQNALFTFPNGWTADMLLGVVGNSNTAAVASTGFGIAGVQTVGSPSIEKTKIVFKNEAGSSCSPTADFTLADFAGRISLLIPSLPAGCTPSLLVVE